MSQSVSRGAGVEACNCKYDKLWVRFLLEKMIYQIFSFLSLNTQCQQAFDGIWGTEYLNSSFNLPTLLPAAS